MGLVLVAVVVALSDVTALGPVGRGIDLALKDLVGLVRWIVPLVLVLAAWAFATGRIEKERWRFAAGVPVLVLAASGLAHFIGSEPSWHSHADLLGRSGGWVGVAVGGGLRAGVGTAGAVVILAALLIVAALVLTGVTLAVASRSALAGVHATAHGVGTFWRERRIRRLSVATVADDTIVPISKARSRKTPIPEPSDDDSNT